MLNPSSFSSFLKVSFGINILFAAFDQVKQKVSKRINSIPKDISENVLVSRLNLSEFSDPNHTIVKQAFKKDDQLWGVLDLDQLVTAEKFLQVESTAARK